MARALQRVKTQQYWQLPLSTALLWCSMSQQPEQCGLSDLAGRQFSLEDTACAGAIAHSLLKQTNLPLQELAGNDEVIAAIALYFQWQDNLWDCSTKPATVAPAP